MSKYKINPYREYRYKTLIIWEHELQNPDAVEAKILKFNQGGYFNV